MSCNLSGCPDFGDLIVVWLIEKEGTELDRIQNLIKTFHATNECINYIQNATNKNIFLVIPSLLTGVVISQVHDLRQLDSIYVVDPTLSWKHEEYTKLRGVFTDLAVLCEQLQQNIPATEESTALISILSTNTTSFEDLNTLDPSFMYSQLLKEILLELHYDIIARKRFIEFCREEYAENARELGIINQFEQEYEHHSPVWWYTKECFLYKTLNRALRTQNIDISCQMGFFIQDLYQQLQQLHSVALPNTPRILYRGQGMFTEEFNKLKKNRSGLLSFNNFLSTSTNGDVSLRFATRSLDKENLEAVLFEIHIDPAICTVPFTSLNGISYYPSEGGILFSMHSIFRIVDIEHMHNRIWNIQLKLTNDNHSEIAFIN